MDTKILWFDVETTGIDPDKHALIQFAGLVDLNGEIIDEFEMKVKPFKNDLLSKNAFEKTGLKKSDLKNFLDPLEGFKLFEDFLSEHINRYDRTEKFILAGKNIKGFDIGFLRKYFLKCNNEFFGSWFWNMSLDIDTTISEAILFGDLFLPNYQLGTLCEAYDIPLNAHEAMSDILATRLLYYKLKGIDI